MSPNGQIFSSSCGGLQLLAHRWGPSDQAKKVESFSGFVLMFFFWLNFFSKFFLAECFLQIFLSGFNWANIFGGFVVLLFGRFFF